MWVLCFTVVLVSAWGLVSPTPFLYNAPRAIADIVSSASASASSSSPSEPFTNIADLRQNRPAKLEEPSKLADNNDFLEEEQSPPEMTNDVLPSLISKKINKILTKLRFISSLSGPLPTPESESTDDDFQKELDDIDREYEKDNNQTFVAKNETEPGESKLEALEEFPESSDEDVKGYFYPRPGAEKLRANFAKWGDNFEGDGGNSKKGNGKVKKAALRDSDVTGEDKTRNNLSPQSVGLYFMELLASAVGLIYGAAAQFENPATRPPAEP